MERGLLMLLHSIIIGLILYIVMVFVFKQNDKVAENRSILISAFILIYMIIFGHSIPNKINGDL
jgi:DMSO reductase anchor subunit